MFHDNSVAAREREKIIIRELGFKQLFKSYPNL